MFNLSTPELIVISLVVILIFGGGRLVDIAKGLGSSIKEFKKSMKDSDPTEDSKKKDS